MVKQLKTTEEEGRNGGLVEMQTTGQCGAEINVISIRMYRRQYGIRKSGLLLLRQLLISQLLLLFDQLRKQLHILLPRLLKLLIRILTIQRLQIAILFVIFGG